MSAQALNLLCQERNPDFKEIMLILSSANGQKDIIDGVDSNGLTPLQQAAFRGNARLVKLLLEHGADVNSLKHTDGYTTLMFAALSGNLEVIDLVLDAGADIDIKNKVNRNAAEMAGFVGQTEAAVKIRSFFPKQEFDFFVENHKHSREPSLDPTLVEPLRRLVMKQNVHPVSVVNYLQKNPELISDNVVNVLAALTDQVFEVQHNEWLSGKLHFLKCVVEESLNSGLKALMKRWMKARESDGFKLNLDNFIRACVRSYRWHANDVFRQTVVRIATLSQEALQSSEGALEVFLDHRRPDSCNTCWEYPVKNRCTGCKEVLYCNQECQKNDWPAHKLSCNTSSNTLR